MFQSQHLDWYRGIMLCNIIIIMYSDDACSCTEWYIIIVNCCAAGFTKYAFCRRFHPGRDFYPNETREVTAVMCGPPPRPNLFLMKGRDVSLTVIKRLDRRAAERSKLIKRLRSSLSFAYAVTSTDQDGRRSKIIHIIIIIILKFITHRLLFVLVTHSKTILL